MRRDFDKLQKTLGMKFKNVDLLRQAMVHRSYINENPKFELDHNERLEFLGDAVLELVVTEHLYKNYPNPEGELTNWRSALVNSKMLSSKAQDLGLNDYLYLSRGEAKDVGKAREIILANAFEALVGAIYLDQDYEAAGDFIAKQVISELPKILEYELYLDPKSKLQELTQDKFNITPIYQVLKEWGPDHARKFRIGVFLDDKIVGEGEGTSKQQAQIAAAEDALRDDKWKQS
jgi:ribonuclease-3